EPACELWVFGDSRSCKLETDGNAVACSFFFGQAQVAYGPALDDPCEAVAAWLVAGVPVRALVDRVPGVELERRAEVLETDPARWHWLHVRDRIADPNDVLAPLRDLLEALAMSSIASQFYSYSSISYFSFSASSHYPWVNDGLPVIHRADGGTY